MRHSLKYLIGIIAGTRAVLVAVATGITAALLSQPGRIAFLVTSSYRLGESYVWSLIRLPRTTSCAARALSR